MNTEQVSKEIKSRLNKVSNLLREIEDILCKAKNDVQSECNYSYICVCEKQSIPELLETISNHSKDDSSRKCEKIICSEKRIKCKGTGGEKISFDVNDISACCRRNDNQNHEKNNTNDLCCKNISNKKIDNTRYNDNKCMYELFKNKLNDINQKYMSYFDENNKNEPNTTVGSTVKSKKTSRL
ncbi:hypothetical protein ACI65C_002650 [Semiaphis heraclei]